MAAAEGPILALISKRLRSLRKKSNRITEMEESISQGKTLNKDQEEILRSKPIITALIEELLKLRLPPPSTAVSDEISLPATNNKKQKARKEKMAEEKNVTSKTDIEDCKVVDSLSSDEVSNDNTSCNGSSEGVTPSPTSAGSRKSRRRRKSKKPDQASN